MNVRIRVTIGFNSKVVNPIKKETSLHLFGGQGLTARSPIHPVPFCLTDREVQTSTFNGIDRPNPGPDYYSLIWNPDRPATLIGQSIGLGVFFITGFQAMCLSQTATVAAYYDAELLHCEANLIGQPTQVLRRLCGVSLTRATGAPHSVCFFNEPIRVTLRPIECLALRLTNSYGTTDASDRIKFQLYGYSFGPLKNEFNQTPFRISYMYKEHPFPQDVDVLDLPSR